ncbi:MAG TPA: MMPL family transporter [Gaiellaceae bacterium]
MLERWAHLVMRFRALVLLVWLAVLVAGVLASMHLTPLLANSFSVPGTDSERARQILQQQFGERPDGTFTVVFRTHDKRGLAARIARAARAVPTGRPGLLHTESGLIFADVSTSFDLQHAKRYTAALRHALRGSPPALVTGQPAVQADVDPVFASDLRRGEAIAVPLTLLVLLAVFGLSLAVAIPFLVAACTIAATLGLVYLIAHEVSMVAYVQNLVELIGLGLAVDYSLLVVHRYREEIARGGTPEDAVARTIATAGRAVAFSGSAVAVGLGLLLVVPVPFIRSMGIGGLLIPLVSVAAGLTLQPALLSLLGSRIGARRTDGAFWGRLSRAIMHRPWRFLAAGTAVLVALAVPAVTLRLTPGSLTGIPSSAESVRGYDALRDALGGGLVTPTHVVIVDGGAAATKRLANELFHDPEVLVVASGKRPPYVAGGGRYRQVIVANRHEWGDAATRRFVDHLRTQLIPQARFPRDAHVYAGGAPPQGVDFVSRTYGALPLLIVFVLAFTYLVLLRAFRSAVLPLKALVLNALSVSATYGVLSLVFNHPIEAWIPVFLFATLFGLSMDYEVFMVSRMREAHDAGETDRDAVAHGLEQTGRIVTAAAAIMVAAFSGFVVGRIEGLREFGVGLAVAVTLDATIVRALLVPSVMAVLGRWNWWLPTGRA